MKLSFAPAFAIVLAIIGSTAHADSSQRILVGRFTFLDTTAPACGIVAWASKADFLVDGSGEKVELAVPCIEMQLAEDSTGQKMPIKVGERYRIVLARKALTPDMQSPYPLNKHPWYLSHVSR